jgi:hypothetical protein
VFDDLDLLRHAPVQEDRFAREPLARPEGRVISGEHTVRVRQRDERADDRVAKAFEPGAHELDDEPPVVAVHDERGSPSPSPWTRPVRVGHPTSSSRRATAAPRRARHHAGSSIAAAALGSRSRARSRTPDSRARCRAGAAVVGHGDGAGGGRRARGPRRCGRSRGGRAPSARRPRAETTASGKVMRGWYRPRLRAPRCGPGGGAGRAKKSFRTRP